MRVEKAVTVTMTLAEARALLDWVDAKTDDDDDNSTVALDLHKELDNFLSDEEDD